MVVATRSSVRATPDASSSSTRRRGVAPEERGRVRRPQTLAEREAAAAASHRARRAASPCCGGGHCGHASSEGFVLRRARRRLRPPNGDVRRYALRFLAGDRSRKRGRRGDRDEDGTSVAAHVAQRWSAAAARVSVPASPAVRRGRRDGDERLRRPQVSTASGARRRPRPPRRLSIEADSRRRTHEPGRRGDGRRRRLGRRGVRARRTFRSAAARRRNRARLEALETLSSSVSRENRRIFAAASAPPPPRTRPRTPTLRLRDGLPPHSHRRVGPAARRSRARAATPCRQAVRLDATPAATAPGALAKCLLVDPRCSSKRRRCERARVIAAARADDVRDRPGRDRRRRRWTSRRGGACGNERSAAAAPRAVHPPPRKSPTAPSRENERSPPRRGRPPRAARTKPPPGTSAHSHVSAATGAVRLARARPRRAMPRNSARRRARRRPTRRAAVAAPQNLGDDSSAPPSLHTASSTSDAAERATWRTHASQIRSPAIIGDHTHHPQRTHHPCASVTRSSSVLPTRRRRRSERRRRTAALGVLRRARATWSRRRARGRQRQPPQRARIVRVRCVRRERAPDGEREKRGGGVRGERAFGFGRVETEAGNSTASAVFSSSCSTSPLSTTAHAAFSK